MEESKTGGPAFPLAYEAQNMHGIPYPQVEPGMTLRDYFAAKAMQALIAARCYPWDRQAPVYAYEIADRMLEARK